MPYLLMLNDMRSSRSEHLTIVGRGDTLEELQAFVAGEKVEPYTDAGEHVQTHSTDFSAQLNGPSVEHTPYYKYHKVFRKGGPLEWYNPPNDNDVPYYFRKIRNLDEVIADTVNAYNADMAAIPILK